MALMASSIEMSFSLSRLRRTLRSMSIAPPPCPRAGGRAGRSGVLAAGPAPRRAELHLHPARAQVGETELTLLAVDLQDDPAVPGGDHPSLDGLSAPRLAVSPGPAGLPGWLRGWCGV